MTRVSYTKSLDALLTPLGFRREKSFWNRIRGDIREQVQLQKSSFGSGVTINIWIMDLVTEGILQSIPSDSPVATSQLIVRIGRLIDGRDIWWKNNPDGPAEVVAAVRDYGLPWLERAWTLEQQSETWFGGRRRAPWRGDYLAAQAVTLFRMGHLDEAIALFEGPPRRTSHPKFVTLMKCVEAWLREQEALRECSPPSP